MRVWVEICVYAVHLGIFYLYIIPTIGLSVKEKCLASKKCSRYLQSVNWNFTSNTHIAYTIDTADAQWSMLRNSMALLWIVMLSNLLIVYILTNALKFLNKSKHERFFKAILRIVFGLVFIVVLHGYHAMITLGIIFVGFLVARSMSNYRQIGFLGIFLFGVGIMLFKESYRLLRYPDYYFLYPLFDRRSYGGLYDWQYPANFLGLRFISYGIDLHRHHINKSREKDENIPENVVLHTNDYDIVYYLSYMLYSPLYMAGPIITYSNFVRQDKYMQLANNAYICIYGLRWMLVFLLMEYLLHTYPFFAITSSGLLNTLTAPEMAVFAYVLLKIMWLKFLLIWRYFRLWALSDGIDPPENMIRCMSNNYSLEMFWRGWHSSFNKWLVEYMYIPLGGSKHKILSVWIIFLFVAFWHDMEWKLFLWGVLNSGFLLIEVLAKYVSKTRFMNSMPYTAYNIIVSISGAVYIVVLIAVNMIGYAIGSGGFKTIIYKFMSYDGIYVFAFSIYFLAIGVSIMRFLRIHRISKP